MSRPFRLVTGILLAALLPILGCSSGGDSSSSAPTSSGPPPVVSPPPPSQPAATAQQEAKPKEGDLPEDVSQWTAEHFKLAHEKKDKKILAAIDALVARAAAGQDADQAVTILRSLMERPAAAKPQGPGGPYGSPGGYGPGGPYGSPSSPESGYPPGSGYPGTPPAGQASPGPGTDQEFESELLKAAATAMVKIGTQAALAAINDLLEAKFEVIDDRLGVEATLTEVTQNIQKPEYEDLVIRVLCNPPRMPKTAPGAGGYPGSPGYGGSPYGSPPVSGYESYPSPESMSSEYGSGYPGYPGAPGMGVPGRKMTGEEIRRMLLDLAKDVLTDKIRKALAEHVMNPKSPPVDKQLFLPILAKPVPENLPVLLVLLQKGDSKQPLVVWLMDVLTDTSAAVLAAVMGAEDPAGMDALTTFAETARIPGITGGQPGMAGYGPGTSSGEYGYAPGQPPPGYPTPSPEYGSPPGAYPAAPYGTTGPQAGPGQTNFPRLTLMDRQLKIPGLPRDVALKAAPRIWSPETVNFVDSRLRQVRSLKENSRDILMAATFPLNSTRARLGAILRGNLEEGPEPLTALGFGSNLFVDPGLVVVLKTLPREDPVKPTTGPRGTRPLGRRPGARPGDPGYGGSTTGPETSGQPYGGAGGQQQQTLSPKARWMLMSESLDRSVCKMLKEAADRLATLDPTSLDGLPAKRPSEFQAIHPNASIVAEYHLDWPNSRLKEELPGVTFDPMRIHYIRAESHSIPSVVAGFYRRKVADIEQRTIADGLWLDGLRTLTDGKPRRQSIDIFITHTAGEIGPQDEVDVVVELLSVEVLSQDAAARAESGTALR